MTNRILTHMKRLVQLNILEPWEHGTQKSIDINIINKEGNQYLMKLNSSISIGNNLYSYFLFRVAERHKNNDLFSLRIKGTFPVEIVYKEDIDENNFTLFNIDDFRNNFLFGEIILS